MPAFRRETVHVRPPSVRNEKILELQRSWERWRERGGLPRLAGLDFDRLHWCLDNLMLLEALPDGDYRYLRYGPAIAQAAGFDMTGKCISDFGGSELSHWFKEIYDKVRAEGVPRYTVHRATHSRSVHSWERLVMPIGDDRGQARFLLVYNAPLTYQHEVLERVLNSASDAVLGFSLLRDKDDKIEDLVFSVVNRRATEILGRDADELIGRRLLELYPGNKDDGLWDLYLETALDGTVHRLEHFYAHDGFTTWFRIVSTPLGDGVLVTFSDITEEKNRQRALEDTITELDMANEALGAQAETLVQLAEDKERARAALVREIEERKKLEAELTRLATTDALTGTLNRRRFMELADTELERARRHGRPLTLMMMDIDHFKRINDTHGHAAGDAALVAFTHCVGGLLRDADVFARLGGEEFAVLLPETAMPAALALAERLRVAVAELTVDAPSGPFSMTVSTGLSATLDGRNTSPDRLLGESDQALYAAKQAGRDRVMRFQAA